MGYKHNMPGFLDPYAVSVEAEYPRYLDPDIVGKIVLKNFALHILGLEEADIRIPLSRHGDLGTYKGWCDAEVRYRNRWYTIETKSSRLIVDPRKKTNPSPRWVFTGLRHSRKGTPRSRYDLVFAVGVNLPGLEDSLGYWRVLHCLQKENRATGQAFNFSLWPHHPAFLDRCGIYIFPRMVITVNDLSISVVSLVRRPDYNFFGWGSEKTRLQTVWHNAVSMVM